MKIEFTSSDHYTWSDFVFKVLSDREYVVFDLEATGPNHETGSVTQIGAIRVRNGNPIDNETFSNLVKPWKEIPKAIEGLTGITNEAVAHAEEFSEVYPEFFEWCGNSVLVTQCGYEFDFPILDAECERSGLPKMQNVRLDAKAIFAYLHRDQFENFSTRYSGLRNWDGHVRAKS